MINGKAIYSFAIFVDGLDSGTIDFLNGMSVMDSIYESCIILPAPLFLERFVCPMRRVFGLLLILLAIGSMINAQSTSSDPKMMHARRLRNPIALDGQLTESVWSEATGFSDFIQSSPIEGGEPTEKTVVWIVYDDEALYIGARM